MAEVAGMLLALLLSCCLGPTYGHEKPQKYNDELSSKLSRLWKSDKACKPGVDYKLNLQEYLWSVSVYRRDWSHEKLFKSFNQTAVFAKPTFKAFRKLLDNYNDSPRVAESYSKAEKREIDVFLDLIVKTQVIKKVHRFLVKKHKFRGDMDKFRRTLYDLWFKLYRRLSYDKHLNSCGFELVFVGERRGVDVIGFRNWIQVYLQEKAGHLDYRGFFMRGTTEELEANPRLLTLQFTWKRDFGKGIVSIFMGTSPEFEIGVYTLVHLMRPQEDPLFRYRNYSVEVFTRGLHHSIRSAYLRVHST